MWPIVLLLSVPLAPLIVLGVHQGVVLLSETLEMRQKYNLARAKADSLGKPLLVVGGPWGTFPARHILGVPAHGFGDVCVDITPSACENGTEVYCSDVRNMPFPDKCFGAVFCSHVLEHLPSVGDCHAALDEMSRVADYIYIVAPTKQSLVAWFAPGHKLWIREEIDEFLVEQR